MFQLNYRIRISRASPPLDCVDNKARRMKFAGQKEEKDEDRPKRGETNALVSGNHSDNLWKYLQIKGELITT